MTFLLLRNIGCLLIAWAFAVTIANPFFENRTLSRIALAFFMAGTALIAAALSIQQ